MEPSGTYGDALRQALRDVGITVVRIGTKISHDYAEVFDGVPSQYDGKDAAVVADLTAIGKGKNWAYETQDTWEQQLRYWVERMECHRRIHFMMALGPLEALLGRHWPEATQVLEVSSATLLRVLEAYGEAAALAADPMAASQLARWGGKLLSANKPAPSGGTQSGAGDRPTPPAAANGKPEVIDPDPERHAGDTHLFLTQKR